MKKFAFRIWAARLLIAVVVIWNLECALVFWLSPGGFATGFELAGIPGAAAVRGFAVLFVMWNIPYLVALWQPHDCRLSLWEAFVMQTIGVLGESYILFSLPPGHLMLHTSLLRFIAFDASGVVALLGALLLANK